MPEFYKAVQYIQLPLLKEYVLVVKICKENENILKSYENINELDKKLFVFFGSVEGEETELPQMIREMIANMAMDGVKARRYELSEFKDNTEMDEYIKKMRAVEKNVEDEINKIQEIIKTEKEKQEKENKIDYSNKICDN